MDLEASAIERFRDHIDAINRELSVGFHSPVSLVEDMGRHILLGDGKRVRPLLFILSCEICRYQRADLYQLSTVFELIHAASLLHDDVLDNAEVRRRRPSANQVWGNHAAVLEGDFLYSKALSIAIRTENIPFLKRLTETTLRMTEGQMMELGYTRRWNIAKDQYMEVITAKTAVLMSAASACGAILSGAGPAQVEALSQFGLYAGIAFQIIDDLLDYTSSEAVFGKPVGKDLREGKMTLPLIYALTQADGKAREEILDSLSEERLSDETCQAVIGRVREGGILDQVRQEARGYVDRAEECLKAFPDSQTRRDLIHLSRHIVDRDH